MSTVTTSISREPLGQVPGAGTVRLERMLPGPAERVWDYLTDSQKRGTWLAEGPMEPRVGGKVELTFRHYQISDSEEATPEKYAGRTEESGETPCDTEGTGCSGLLNGVITQWEPGRKLSYTWNSHFTDDSSEVAFELIPQGEETMLIVTHRRLPNRKEQVSVGAGWHAHLGILIDQLNGQPRRPFWSTHAALETQYEELIPID